MFYFYHTQGQNGGGFLTQGYLLNVEDIVLTNFSSFDLYDLDSYENGGELGGMILILMGLD